MTPTGWKFFGNLMDSGDEKLGEKSAVFSLFSMSSEDFVNLVDLVVLQQIRPTCECGSQEVLP